MKRGKPKYKWSDMSLHDYRSETAGPGMLWQEGHATWEGYKQTRDRVNRKRLSTGEKTQNREVGLSGLSKETKTDLMSFDGGRLRI